MDNKASDKGETFRTMEGWEMVDRSLIVVNVIIEGTSEQSGRSWRSLHLSWPGRFLVAVEKGSVIRERGACLQQVGWAGCSCSLEDGSEVGTASLRVGH